LGAVKAQKTRSKPLGRTGTLKDGTKGQRIGSEGGNSITWGQRRRGREHEGTKMGLVEGTGAWKNLMVCVKENQKATGSKGGGGQQ